MAETTSPLPTTYLPRQEDDEIDLSALIGNILGARKLIGACVAVAFLIGGTYAYFAQPIYQVDALVQVEDSKSSPLGGAVKDLDGLFDVKSEAATEIEILRSRLVLGRTVDALGLDIIARPKMLPKIGEALARRGLQLLPTGWFGYGNGQERITVSRFDVPAALRGETFMLTVSGPGTYRLQDASGTVLGQGQVGKELRATVQGQRMSLFVRDVTASPGTDFILCKLPRLSAINALSGSFTASEKVKQSGIIALILKTPDAQRGVAALNTIANGYVRQNVERKSAEAEQTLKYLEQTLPQTKQDLDAAEVRFNAFRTKNGTVDVDKEGALLLEEGVKTDTALIELQGKRKELLARFTAAHPSVIALDSQISLLEGRRKKFNGQVDQLPQTQQEILRLTRDLKVSQETYTAMLNNAQQLKVVRGGAVGNVRVIDYAELPLKPVEPRRTLIVLLSLLLGGVLGISIALLRLALRHGVKDARDIEARLGLSVLATVPYSKRQVELNGQRSRTSDRRYVLAQQDAQDGAVESLRALRTSLHFVTLDARNNALLISGPAPGVGKSFLSVNLAMVLVQAGERVLLLDADMRRGFLNTYFGKPRDHGLSDVIAGAASLDQVIQHTDIEGLDFISTGAIPPNPSELLLHPHFEQALTALSARYDRIVIDAPPIMAVTDAAIIGRHVGTTLVAVRYAQTPLAELDGAVRRLQQAGVVVSGVLLNGVESQGRYGYGYTYGYTYSYRSHKKKD